MSDQESPKLPDKVPVHYQASTTHRVLHVDGVTTSLTPQLELQAAFYQTLQPLPTDTEHDVRPDGSLGDAPTLPTRLELIRQVETTLIINPVVVARIVQSWQALLNHLKVNGSEAVRKAIEEVEASKVTLT